MIYQQLTKILILHTYDNPCILNNLQKCYNYEKKNIFFIILKIINIYKFPYIPTTFKNAYIMHF